MDNIKLYINENYDDMIATLRELCKIPAPSLKEKKRAEFCKNWLLNIGADGVYIDDALNVVLPINCENKDKVTVVCAHMDTVFPDTEPMPFIEDENKIYCPGCGDDTSSLAVLLYTAKYIIENNIEFKDGLLIVCNSAEEGLGNLKGTEQIFKNYKDRISRFISLDSNIDKIADRCVGSCRYEVTAVTKGGHSYLDYGNANAIHVLSQIVSRIYDIYIPKNDAHKTTVNVGKISGGTSVNTIAQRAKMLCEYRSDDAEQLDIMRQSFFEIFAEAQNSDVKIETEIVGKRPCAKGVDQAELDKMKTVASEIVTRISGKAPVFRSSSTDCNIPLSLGVPAICIGVYDGDGQHTREEWIYKESLRKGLEIGINIVLSMCVYNYGS